MNAVSAFLKIAIAQIFISLFFIACKGREVSNQNKPGKALLWDATCVDSYAVSHLNISSVTAGAAASEAEVKKQNKYRSLSHDYIFVAVGVETSGALGQQATQFLKDLGRKLIAATGEPRSSSYLLQRISIAIQRGNSASILATHPKSRGLDEIFLSSFK